MTATLYSVRGVHIYMYGSICAAILYYRQAVQLVPDIEFRVIGDEPQVTSDDDDGVLR